MLLGETRNILMQVVWGFVVVVFLFCFYFIYICIDSITSVNHFQYGLA